MYITNNQNQENAALIWKALPDEAKAKLKPYYQRLNRAASTQYIDRKAHSKFLALKQSHIVYKKYHLSEEMFLEIGYYLEKIKVFHDLETNAFYVAPFDMSEQSVAAIAELAEMESAAKFRTRNARYKRTYRAKLKRKGMGI